MKTGFKIAVIMCVLVVSFLTFTGCEKNKEEKQAQSGNESPKYMWMVKENNSLWRKDIKTADKMCKTYLNLFYKTMSDGKDRHIDNMVACDSLNKYNAMKMKHTKRLLNDDNKKLETTFKSTGKTSMLAKNNKCISVEFKSIVEHDDGGFGSTHKFLVVNQDGKLKIADWYEPSFVGDREMDYYTRGDIKNLNNPNIWMNEKITDKIFKKAEKYLEKWKNI